MRLHRTICIVTIFIFSSLVIYLGLEKNNYFKDVKIVECENFEYYEAKISCYSYITQNFSFCSLVPNLKPECYALSTIKKASAEFCNSMENELGKAICISNLAVKLRNPQICENLSQPYLIETCLSRFLPIFYGYFTEEQCKIISHESSRLTCLAIVKNDKSYCRNITLEPFEKDFCFAFLEKDMDLCVNAFCKENMAIYFKNLEVCNELEGTGAKAKCIGIISKSFDECEKLEGGALIRDLCKLYAIYAKELNL